jgi:hypothetical protein
VPARSALAHALVEASLERPAAVLAGTVLLGALAALGLLRLGTDVGYRAFLGERHPAVLALDRFVARFGGGLPLVAVWHCERSPGCQRALDPAALRMAHAVGARMGSVPGVRRVLSPATAPLLVPQFLDLPRARRLAPDGAPALDLAELVPRALADPLWLGQLVSPDGRTGALLVELDASDGETGRRVYGALELALAEHERQGFVFARIGGPVEFVVAGAELEREIARLLPVMVVLIGAVITAVFRSLVPSLLALASMGLAVLATLGLSGWLGWPRNSLTQALAPLVLVIGVCDSVHLLSRYAAARELEPDPSRRARERAVLRAAGETGRACWLTTVTTAAAFVSFAPSPLASISRFGWLAAFGVGIAFLVTFTVLPVALVRAPVWRTKPSRGTTEWEGALEAGAKRAARARRSVLGGSALLCTLASFGLLRLSLDASFEDLYGEQSRVVEWARSVERRLRAPDTLEIAVLAPAGADPLARDSLARVERIARALEQVPGLGRARSLLDALQQLGAYSGLDGETALENGGPFVRLLDAEDPSVTEHYFDADTSALRISVEARKLPQAELREALERVHALLAQELPPNWGREVTGPLAVVRELIDALRATQLQSFALSFTLVFGLVWALLRGVKLALLAMVPTLLPLVLTLGAMGALGIALDPGTAMVAAVVLGVAVDGAIHLLSAYSGHAQTVGPGLVAMSAAVRRTGRALCTTSLALSAGFALLALSPWQSIASFGLVSSLALLGALFADLALLPALVANRVRDRGAAG